MFFCKKKLPWVPFDYGWLSDDIGIVYNMGVFPPLVQQGEFEFPELQEEE